MSDYTPSYESAEPLGEEKKDNKTTIIIIAVVAVLLLCCCCPAIIGSIWAVTSGAIENWVSMLPALLV